MRGAQARKPFSIGEAVRKLQETHTDVSQSSLRFFQHQGLIAPELSPGGHRFYDECDLARIRQIKTWQAKGFSLADIAVRLRQLDQLPAPEERSRAFLELALTGHSAAAGAMVLAADDVGIPLAETFGRVLAPALVGLGDRWRKGALRVDQEHEVSEVCKDLIAELTFRHMRPPDHDKVLLASSVEHERHDLGLRMVCGMLRTRGVTVHFLGAGLPTPLLLESIALRRPDVLLLSTTLAEHRSSVEHLMHGLEPLLSRQERPHVIVGGQASMLARDLVEPSGSVVAPDVPLSLCVEQVMALVPD